LPRITPIYTNYSLSPSFVIFIESKIQQTLNKNFANFA